MRNGFAEITSICGGNQHGRFPAVARASRVTLTADDCNFSVTMEIEPGRLVLKSNTPDGEAQEEMVAVLNGEVSQ